MKRVIVLLDRFINIRKRAEIQANRSDGGRDVTIGGGNVTIAGGNVITAGGNVISAGRDVVINTTSDQSRNTSGQGNNEVKRDEFRPSFCAPPNPREVLLDFGNPLDDTESGTPEAKVLREILRDAANEEKTRIVSMYGKAGVGKSCILRALGDEGFQERFKLKERFPDGIYFISLGMDANESTLIQGLAEMVGMCGGEELGRELRGKENVRIVVKEVKEWMKGRKCLVLLDDCWERNGLGRSNVRQLGQILSDHSGSVLVVTTRFKDLARVGIAIKVEERETESEEAKAMLLRHAKLEGEEIEDEEEEEAFCRVLNMCGGLPLFLSVVGGGVAELGMELECEEFGKRIIWRRYWEKLQAVGQDEFLDTENDEYPDLNTTLRLSLELLSKRRGKRLGSLCVSKLSFEEMHRSLCVFKKQARIPINVCRRLWKVKSDEAAFCIVEWFAGVGLADIESRRCGEKHVEYMRVHDLVHMFAVECAEREEGVGKWHGELLGGYLPKVRGSKEVREWWSVCKDKGEDEYLSENVCRHLVSSGNVKEAEGLLVSGEWSKLRHKVGGLSRWKGDFRECLGGGKKDGGSASEKESENEIEKGLELVRDAVIDCWGVVHENPRELGYQVVGRLIACENEVVRKYLRSIEEGEYKPWLKPIQRCWEEPGKGMMIGEFHLGDFVFDVGLDKKSFTAVVDVDGEIAILDLKEMRVTAKCAGHNGKVVEVGISCDGKRVLSLSTDWFVRQWDSESGEEHKDECVRLRYRESDEEREGSDKVMCVAFRPENSFIVMGSERGKIRVWDVRCGERVGRTMDACKPVDCIALSPHGMIAAGLQTGSVVLYDVETCRPMFEELEGHKPEAAAARSGEGRYMRSCAFSGDGRLVASGADDGTVRVWNVESKAQVGDPFAHLDGDDVPFRVAFSADGKQIFSANRYGSIRVWDVANGAEIRSWQAHAYWATCVAVSGDLSSRLAVSGSGGGTVRVWDLEATRKKENEHTYHKDVVRCVVASADGSVFVTASEDKTVRIWDGGDGRPLGEALCGHEDRVYGIAVSPDGRRVASVSSDCTLRVWDVGARAQVGNALRGHEGSIECVAYSPTGEFVVSGSWDKTVRVWRVIGDCENVGGVGESASKCVKVAGPGGDEGLSSREVLRLGRTFQHNNPVISVAVSRDGETVVSGLRNGEIWVWNMKSGKCIDRKQTDNDYEIDRIEISETNRVVTTNYLDQELRWWLDSKGGLTHIRHREDGTGIAQAQSQEGFVTHEFSEAVCNGRTVRMNSSDEKIATLPDNVWPGAWAYNAQRRMLCVGYRDGRVLFFRVER